MTGAGADETLAGDGPQLRPTGLVERLARAHQEQVRVGRFVVLEAIGSGAMGNVYLAYDPELDRRVAIKVLRQVSGDADADSRGHARLLREAQSLAKLAHPNVIAVYDVGTVEHQVFMAMEYVEGQTLDAWLAEAPPFEAVLDAFVQAGRGLAAAHASGIVHRDFKPQNVLVGEDERVRVLDFGIARGPEMELTQRDGSADPELSAELGLTKTGAALGTPAYMSPEQHSGNTVTPHSDQFSFCVALYEAAYGQRPFEGDTLAMLSVAILEGRLRSPPKSSPAPGWLWDVVGKGLRSEASDRYPTMDELLVELARDRRAALRRRLGWLAGGVVGAGASFGAFVAAQQTPGCDIGTKRVAQIWDAQQRSALAGAFEQTGVPYASDSWERVARSLDGYATSWAAAYRDACEATLVEGTQTEQELALRMACLNQRLVGMSTLLELFAQPDPTVVEKAASAAQRLPTLDLCSDLEALQAPVRPPDDPEVRERVESFRAELARAEAIRAVGRPQRAIELAARIDERASELDYAPIQAEAGLMHGKLLRESDKSRAREILARAFFEAQAGAHDSVMIRAASYLVDATIPSTENEIWIRSADAVLQRFGDRPKLRGIWLNAKGNLLLARGDYAEALTAFQEGTRVRESVAGPNTLELIATLSGAGIAMESVGDYEGSAAAHRHVHEIIERASGPRHPDAATAMLNLGVALQGLSQHDEALRLYDEARSVWEEVYGSEHPALVVAHVNIANALADKGALDQSVDHYRAALEIEARAPGSQPLATARVHDNLGNVLEELGRSDEAIVHLERGLELRETSLNPEHADLAYSLFNLGEHFLNQEQLDRALEYFERALEVAESTDGVTPFARILTGIGQVWLRRGRADQAVASLERAVEVGGKDRDPIQQARTQFALARALSLSDVRSERAQELAQSALNRAESDPRGRTLVEQIGAWLKKR